MVPAPDIGALCVAYCKAESFEAGGALLETISRMHGWALEKHTMHLGRFHTAHGLHSAAVAEVLHSLAVAAVLLFHSAAAAESMHTLAVAVVASAPVAAAAAG